MSGKRMIHEGLFSNEELAALPIQARYLYLATIVHADDEGRMRADARYLKVKAFPFDDSRAEDVRTWRDLLASGGLLLVYEVDGKEYLEHPKWDKWQTLRKDRKKASDCPPPATNCQPDDNQVTTIRQPTAAEVKEVKIREVKEVNRREVKAMTTKDSLALKPEGITPDPELIARAEALAARPFPVSEVEADPMDKAKKTGKIKLYAGPR